MQESMVHRKMQELVYGVGSPYGVNTGGRLLNLRTSCSNEKVREYHRQNYHLKNMLITGFPFFCSY